MESQNLIVNALVTYGLTAVIAMIVAALIAFIGWAVKDRKPVKDEESEAAE